MKNFISIVVADDHPIVREGLISVLETQPDFKVIGEASDGEGAIRVIGQMQPDIVLLDIEMPGMDGVEVVKHLYTSKQKVKVIMFTVFDTDERIINAIRAGAKGYLLKGASREDIFDAIRVVSNGGSLLQPLVAARLFDHMTHQPETLSPREMEVMHLLAKGMTNKQIADRISVSERTVKFHVSSILGKLGAENRTEAVKIAVNKGIISL